VQEFVARCVDSVEQMEILCVLSREPRKWWSAAEVFRHVQSSEKSVLESLRGFVKKGLLGEAEDRFQISSSSEALVLETTKTYQEFRVSMVELIYNKPADAIQDFAKAFRLRKEK
jgi:predicted transcriptional regulator